MVETIVKSSIESNIFIGKLAEMRKFILKVSELRDFMVTDGGKEEPVKPQIISSCQITPLKTLG